MRGTHFEHHLLLFAQIEGLHMTAAAQIPNVHLMPVFTAEEQLGLHAVFNHIRRAPFAAEQSVESQMPPKSVMQKSRTAVHLPLTEEFERFAIEHENAARPIPIGLAKRAGVDPLLRPVNG